MSMRFEDRSPEFMRVYESAITRTLTVLGQTMVEVITDYMLTNYGRPIWLTGDLLRSISFRVDFATKTVIVGSNLHYAEKVHQGTTRMTGRPYIKDALLENADIWKEIIINELGKDFRLRIV